MTVHTIGDSHAKFTFAKIPNVCAHTIGPITMKRVGYLEDKLLATTVSSIRPKTEDTLVFCFGEIDIRCWVKVHVDKRPTNTVESVLTDWIERYLNAIDVLFTNGAKKAIMSIVPPTTAQRANSVALPVAGSDQERSEYTKLANRFIQDGCQKRGFLYLDVYSHYADNNGMLYINKADYCVHIVKNEAVKQLLVDNSLI